MMKSGVIGQVYRRKRVQRPKPKSPRYGGKQISPKVEPEKPKDKVKIVIAKTSPEEDLEFTKKILKNKKNNVESNDDFVSHQPLELVEDTITPEELSEIGDSMQPEFYVVIDFEATCGSSVPRDEMEIIEFGAVLVDRYTLTIQDEFTMFIRPVLHSELTKFCVELTSISQEDVDNAYSFPTVLKQFNNWLSKHDGKKTFCSWGKYDKTQLLQDCELHDAEYPFNDEHVNVKTMFSDIRGYKRRYGLTSALKKLKLTFEGTHHRGIDDARNVARVMKAILS